jgi:hypothetical protein
VSRFRRLELHQCLGFARAARKALEAGDLRRAFRHHLLAVRSLGLARAFGGGCSVTATATLCRTLSALGDRIEDALVPPPKVEAWELVAPIADGLKILQTRDGVDVTDAQILERARNIAAGLVDRWKFVAIEPSPDACPQSPQSGEVGAN